MRLVAASSLTSPELERVREIYFAGFEPHLRSDFEDLLADTALVLIDSVPLGLAVLRPLGDTGWVFLRYFTVGEKGRGLGEHLWNHLRMATGHPRMIYDVEDPAEHGISEAEESIRRRRIAFYRRLGAVLLPINGYLPPHGPAGHPMLLMAVDDASPVLDDLERITLAVYEHRYGVPATDPLVARTLRLTGVTCGRSRPSSTR